VLLHNSYFGYLLFCGINLNMPTLYIIFIQTFTTAGSLEKLDEITVFSLCICVKFYNAELLKGLKNIIVTDVPPSSLVDI
jgi:hypothetical protein